jgi:hypothetical protein
MISYTEADALAAQAESNGGYIHADLFGRFEIGDVVLEDKDDMLQFLTALLHRAEAREKRWRRKATKSSSFSM